MRMLPDGSVTLPKEIRDHLGLKPDAELDFELDGEYVRLRKVADPPASRGALLVDHLRGRLYSQFTTDDLMEFTRGPYTDLENPDPGT